MKCPSIRYPSPAEVVFSLLAQTYPREVKWPGFARFLLLLGGRVLLDETPSCPSARFFFGFATGLAQSNFFAPRTLGADLTDEPNIALHTV